jgi:hypothetical protein
MTLKRKKAAIAEKPTSNISFLTNPDSKVLPYLQVVLLIYVIILTFPYLLIDTRGDTDSSWYIGLYKATDAGLLYGRDVVFTYGPLGFLTIPIFINKTLWAYSAVYTLLLYVLTIFGCSLYIRKMKANLVKTLIFAVIFAAIFNGWLIGRTGRDFELVFSVFIFSYLYTLMKRSLIPLSALAFFYSTLPFIKFSAALAACITGAAFLYILIRNKRGKEAIIFLIVCLASFSALALLLLGTPKAIFRYLYGCWQIASGYNDAMGIEHGLLKKDYLFAIFAWVLYIGLLVYCALRKRKFDLIYLVLGFGVLFLYFKLGFVRHDHAHVIYFYSMWLLVFGLYFLRSFADAKIIRYFVLLFIFVMLYQCGVNIFSLKASSFLKLYMPGRVPDKLRNLQLSFNLFRGIGTEEQTAKVKTQLMEYFPLRAETVEMLSGHTMDVFPTDIAITEAYGLKWHPRPVFQSYSAYTEYLDSINAKHFNSDSAPQYVLYALSAIDGRYPIFEEPATFRTLLQNYEPCGQDEAFIILKKNPSADTGSKEYIGTAVGKFGQIISLPRLNDGLLFAEIKVEYSLPGSAWKFLYKPPNTYIAFLNNGQVIGGRYWRFVPANAMDGLFVSEYVANQNDLLEIWKGNIRQDITGIAILTEHPVFFKDKITAQFFKVSAP